MPSVDFRNRHRVRIAGRVDGQIASQRCSPRPTRLTVAPVWVPMAGLRRQVRAVRMAQDDSLRPAHRVEERLSFRFSRARDGRSIAAAVSGRARVAKAVAGECARVPGWNPRLNARRPFQGLGYGNGYH
jgi:hypothetical protein